MKLQTLVLGGLLFSGLASGFETDMYKYIPPEAQVWIYDLGVMNVYFWDKNQDEIIQQDELFLDLNDDMIPDISFEEILNRYLRKEKIRKESENA